MKRIIFVLIAQLLFLTSVSAQGVDGMKVDNLQMKRNGEYIAVNMDVDFSSLDVASNRAVLFTPMLVNGNDSVDLSAIGVYGRNRYYYYVRNNHSILSKNDDRRYRASQCPDSLQYSAVLPYQDWMNGAYLVLHRCDYGCCNKIMNEQFTNIGLFKERVFAPKYVYVRPAVESVKTRSLSGTAYIDFVVNTDDIRPEYRQNKQELDKIQGTIDSVKADKDITITALSIKGYASPEGPYKGNERLAKARTESLKKYVMNLYHFDSSFITTSYEPEDWAGLRKYVEASDIANKAAIIELIDSDREPDNKEWKIKSTYADDYKHLLNNCYPALRHSDYKIEYNICHYTNIEDIKRIFAESPKKLSLEEFYLLALQYESDSRHLNDIFETAVRIYPDDEVANINAAISEMQNGDIISAEPHLKKVGNSPQALYVRGIYYAHIKDYDNALQLLQQAHEAGIAEAADAIEQINEIK